MMGGGGMMGGSMPNNLMMQFQMCVFLAWISLL